MFYNKWINGKGKSLYCDDENTSLAPDMNSIPHLCCVHNKCIILHNIGNNENESEKKISARFNRSDSSKSIVSTRLRRKWVKTKNISNNKSEVFVPKPPLYNKNKPPCIIIIIFNIHIAPKSFHVNIINK